MYYCYVLRSLKDNYLYIGISNNPFKRLDEHNNGKTKSTKSRVPFKIIHIEIFYNRINARKFEKYLKSGIGREIIKELIIGV
ncbi:MAG TPA: GIY-YIG nuclease family protein [Patescibacteria group bacterium]|nr:GIY-YIG nuclease family protein [Patescibacteria group bacterium]